MDKPALVSRTGYTGEDGFEIYIAKEEGPKLWNLILDAGKDKGLLPVGLGARDTLRFEANLPLYGQELSESITPIEAGLKFAVKVNKEADFIGKDYIYTNETCYNFETGEIVEETEASACTDLSQVIEKELSYSDDIIYGDLFRFVDFKQE